MRVRKHANPFNFYREMPKLQLADLFPHVDRPLHLDIGFAHGEFLVEMAKTHLDNNYLGLEVRLPLVEKVSAEIKQAGLTNAHVIGASSLMNLNIIPDHCLDVVTIFFADPWFKAKHHKRRILNPTLLKELPSKLKQTAVISFQTDVESLYQDTLGYIRDDGQYSITLDENGVHHSTDFGVQTYFESRCLAKSWPIYRIGFRIKV